MEIKNIETLVGYVKGATPENAAKAIIEYGNKRVSKGVEDAWTKSAIMWRKAFRRRQRRIKNHILDFNDEQSMIDLINFIRFFSAVEDAIKFHSERGSSDTREALADINNLMYNKLGKIRLDRRLNFTDNGWEAFSKNDEEEESERFKLSR